MRLQLSSAPLTFRGPSPMQLARAACLIPTPVTTWNHDKKFKKLLFFCVIWNIIMQEKIFWALIGLSFNFFPILSYHSRYAIRKRLCQEHEENILPSLLFLLNGTSNMNLMSHFCLVWAGTNGSTAPSLPTDKTWKSNFITDRGGTWRINKT